MIVHAGFRFASSIVFASLLAAAAGCGPAAGEPQAGGIALASHNTRYAFVAGLVTALGAAVSMGFSEALSDTGTETGRGSAVARGVVTGTMTTLGGVFHSLPFVISNVNSALVVAGIVVACELTLISLIRKRFLDVPLRVSLLQVALGGALIVAAGVLLGSA